MGVSYLSELVEIISWLVRNGYSVSLVGSDNGIEMSEEIVASEPSVRSYSWNIIFARGGG